LIEIVERLLQAEKEVSSQVGDQTADLEEVQPDPPLLSPEDQEQAYTLLASINQRCRLSDVLEEMASQGLSPKVQDLVVTTLLKAIGQQDSLIHLYPLNTRLAGDRYIGHDLLIDPQVSDRARPNLVEVTRV